MPLSKVFSFLKSPLFLKMNVQNVTILRVIQSVNQTWLYMFCYKIFTASRNLRIPITSFLVYILLFCTDSKFA